MHELMRRVVNAKFDAGAVLRGKNNPMWRVFNKATVSEDSSGRPVAFRFSLPDADQAIERPLDEQWLRSVSEKEMVDAMLGWLKEARGGSGAAGADD